MFWRGRELGSSWASLVLKVLHLWPNWMFGVRKKREGAGEGEEEREGKNHFIPSLSQPHGKCPPESKKEEGSDVHREPQLSVLPEAWLCPFALPKVWLLNPS